MAEQRNESPVANLRLYRVALIPALIAVIAVMFSLDGIPDPIDPVTPTGTFDSERAASLAREIVRDAPEREPGSAGDERTADLVRQTFNDVPAGVVTEQTATIDETTRRDIVLSLPGEAENTVLIVANRTAASEGAASSAAATGILLELAFALGVAHDSTYMLASTSGGAHGIADLLENLPEREAIDAVIVIDQPGAAEPSGPFALTTSTTTDSGPLQLRRTAESAIETQVGESSPSQSGFNQLARLAFPSGLSDQALLIADGIDAVAISSSGERPLSGADDEADAASPKTIDAFGRSLFALIDAVDLAPGLVHGPSTYVEAGENLIPGWTLVALSLALIFPVLLTAIDACARVSRREGSLAAAIAWAAARCLPLVGGLALLYGLTLVGLIPDPGFPFDPGEFESGARTAASFTLIAIAAIASATALRHFKITGRSAPAGSLAPAGLLSALAGVALWLANPYLALLFAPAAHVWLLADGPSSHRRSTIVVGAALLSLLPVLAAIGSVSGSLELGSDAPWFFTLMLADGQISFLAALGGCFISGSLIAASALAIGGGGRLPATPGAPR